MRIYRSSDLVKWKQASEFGAGFITADVQWECPDLFPLPVAGGKNKTTAWVLTASAVSQKNFTKPPVFSENGEYYFVGKFDGRTFVANASSAKVEVNVLGPPAR